MMPNNVHLETAKKTDPSAERKKDQGGTEFGSSSASEANKKARKAVVIGDTVCSKMLNGLLHQR